MNAKLLLLASAAAVTLTGCYTTGRNVSKYDKFQNVTINTIDGNGIPPQSLKEFGQLYLTPSQVVSNDIKIYALHIHLDIETPGLWPGDALVKEAEPLRLILDQTNRLEFPYLNGFSVHRPATYRATEPQLRALAAAQAAELRWYHSAGYTERKLRPANIENFRRFVAQFIDGQPVAGK